MKKISQYGIAKKLDDHKAIISRYEWVELKLSINEATAITEDLEVTLN